MKFVHLILSMLAALTLASSCSSVSVEDYAKNNPKFVPQKFFSGKLLAHGIVKNRLGKVIRYFNADIVATWKDGIGTLEEKFIFDDGEIQYRTWTLTPQSSINSIASYNATAGDVVGTATGSTAGNSFNLKYVLAVKHNGSTTNLNVNDWMWLINENTVLNESTLTKFGFKVGSIQVTIVKD